MSDPCQDFLEAIPLYLDAELPASELREFQGHLSGCTSCREATRIAEDEHRTLQKLLRTKPQVPDLLVRRIMDKLDHEEEVERAHTRARWRSWSLPTGASICAVASLVFFAWSGITPPSSIPTASSERPALDSRRDTPRAFIQNTNAVAYTPRFARTNARLREQTARSATNRGATFVYDVSLDSGRRYQLDVHVVPTHSLHLEHQQSVRVGDHTLWLDSQYGYHTVTTHNDRGVAYIFASRMSPQQLLSLVTDSNLVARSN